MINISATQSKEVLCLGLVEEGKRLALMGNHNEALRHYREALRVARECQNHEVFFHHATQCVLESLELSGAHALVRDYCERTEEYLGSLPATNALLNKQRAANLERLGLAYLQLGETEVAKETLGYAVKLADAKALPLAESILGWLRRGFCIETQRLRGAQTQHHYFVVRKDQLRTDIAVKLPPEAGRHPSF